MKLGVIGKGKAATALVPLLRDSGVDISWWWSRRDGSSTADLSAVDVILIAVADRAIADISTQLAKRPSSNNEIWLHLSGFHPGKRCRVTPEIPKAAGAFHPLCALNGTEHTREQLKGCVAGIDGDSAAIDAANVLARLLEMEAVQLTDGTKKLYHAAAVTVAGHVTALFDRASGALSHCGFEQKSAHRALLQLMGTAVTNLQTGTPKEVMTGPIARGDVDVTTQHIEALQTVDPELAAIYESLSKIATELLKD